MEMTNNLCNTCTNIGCEFQSGILRTECAFYKPPHIEPDNCGNYVDDVKQKILDLLAEEPTMVLSTAYAYAKNYVNYGEDITKAWTTAVQQTSILEKVRQKAWVEAYDRFKADYEARLRADKVTMLKELKQEIEELEKEADSNEFAAGWLEGVNDSQKVIKNRIEILKTVQKINALRGEQP